jgi:beta-glucanase (GH16 family)
MKSTLTSLLGGAALLFGASQPVLAQTYQQVWADEFNGTAVNTSNWVFETGGGGWGNNEKQYYQASNAAVANGELVITARKQAVGGMPYTSARLKTQGLKQFTYGRMEARIKVPLGQGLWPAFWMLGANINSVSWPACGEIDIMEQVNADSRTYGTAHWDSNGHAQYGQSTAMSANTYHIYSVEWTPTAIRWYVDGAKYNEMNITNGTGSTEEFQRPFFLLLNLAVAGDWPGQTVDESKLPATMNVDYVRVYQLSGASTGTARTLQAEAANVNSGMAVETCSEGGQDMGNVDAGDYLVFNNINFPVTGTYTIDYRVASPNGGTVSSDLNAGSTQLGSTAIPATGGWQNWTTVTKTVNINAGTYNFGVYAQTAGWNINWIRITNPSGARMAFATSPDAASPTVAGLYPNPVAGSEFLRTEPELVGQAYQILDALGRVAGQGTVGVQGLNVAPLRAGQYTLLLTSPTQERSSRHFSKQ